MSLTCGYQCEPALGHANAQMGDPLFDDFVLPNKLVWKQGRLSPEVGHLEDVHHAAVDAQNQERAKGGHGRDLAPKS